ncbi:MAG: histidine phosphatase family protein [Erysipelotrichaceae bacterium]
MSTNIILVRHGKTDMNEKGLLCGWYEAQLSDKGIDELKKKKVKLVNYRSDLYFSSSLNRCVDTFNILFDDVKLEQTLDEFREICFGDLELHIEDEIDMPKLFNDWVLGNNKSFENYDEFNNRLRRGFEIIINKLKESGLNSATVVTHGGLIMTIIYHYFKIKPDDFMKHRISNGDAIVLSIDNGNIQSINYI